MSDRIDDINGSISDKANLQHQVCRVAYTINNHQPVASTIISNQPLFYMDFESSFYEDEEDMSFDAADIGILDQEIRDFKTELEAFERFSSEANTIDSAEKVETFLKNKTTFSVKTKDQPIHQNDIQNLIDDLQKSRLADAYIECVQTHNVKIAYCNQIEKAHYDRQSAQILINPALEEVEQKLMLTQELRRHWQHRQGALINPLMFHPDNAVLVHRAQMADLATSTVRIAWELQLSGDKAVWERIENSSMEDLARAFAREAFLDFRTINNGQAAAATFEAWFLSERPQMQDKILVNQMLADYKGYVFDKDAVAHAITPSLIAALGVMPFGKNYLAEHATTILSDSLFTEIRDRANANFLWFIKFERSFRDAETDSEQELQHCKSSSANAHSRDGMSNHIQDQTDGQTGQIITLFESQSGDKSEKGSKRMAPKSRSKRRSGHDKPSNNIVYLRT